MQASRTAFPEAPEALIESSFRRLLASLDQEREQIRAAWARLSEERDQTTEELEKLRQDTEEWCYREKLKIDAEWQRLNKLSEDMSKMWTETEVIQINCSGHIFTIPKQTMCGIAGSVLAEMFSDTFIHEIPRDEEGRFFLDFNPQCFSVVVEYLRNRRLRADAPLPVVPVVQRRNMELLAEAWKLWPFLKPNRMNPLHGTSLHIATRPAADQPADGPEPATVEVVRATHPGWQVVGAEHPLPVSSASYFEVTVLSNPDARGGLAVGLCNHLPQGPETHSIRLQCCVLYNSNNGLLGDALGDHDVQPGLQLGEGERIGVRHDVISKSLQWFHNGTCIGTSTFLPETLEHWESIYPIFGLYVPGQAILVDFRAAPPRIE